MTIEQFQLKISAHGILLLELGDESSRPEELRRLASGLKAIGASPLGKCSFVLPPGAKGTVSFLKEMFQGLLRQDDKLIVVSTAGEALSATIMAPPRTDEGVVVRKLS